MITPTHEQAPFLNRGTHAALIYTVLAVTAITPRALVAQQGVTHQLPLSAENIHWGFYDASLEPVVAIRSGDRVYFENLLSRGLGRLRLAGISEDRFLPSMLNVEERETVRIGSHPLNGPVYVEDAEAGDVLEVHLVDIGFLVDYGVSGILARRWHDPDGLSLGRAACLRNRYRCWHHNHDGRRRNRDSRTPVFSDLSGWHPLSLTCPQEWYHILC